MIGLGPELPRNWYLIGPASLLKAGRLVSHNLAGQAIVVWRGESGGLPVAMAAHCAHMGCHLASGSVRGDHLRCGLHHREIGPDGIFARGSALRQRTYPACELLGGLFVYLGPEAEPPPLSALSIDDCTASYAGQHHFPVPWQALVANGFDAEHLAAVHDRELAEPPVLEEHSRREMQLRYVTRPKLRGLADRVIALLAKDGIHGSIRALGGTMMLVESRIGKRESFILLSFLPDSAGGTLIRGLAGVRGVPGPKNRLLARIAGHLFRAFLKKDLDVLDRLEWHEPAHAETLGDALTQQLCAHFRSLDSV